MRTRTSAYWFAAAVGLAVVLGGAPAIAADATGTWTWTVERNGNTVESSKGAPAARKANSPLLSLLEKCIVKVTKAIISTPNRSAW